MPGPPPKAREAVHIGNMSWKFLDAMSKAGFRHLGGSQDAGAAKLAPIDPKVRSKSGEMHGK